MTFVPSDILTLYAAGIALLRTPGVPKAGPWTDVADPLNAVSLICLVLTPLFIVALRVIAAKRPGAAPFVWPVWACLSGMIGFVAYVLGSYQAITGNAVVGGLVVLFAAPLIERVNTLVGAIWPAQAVPTP